MKLSTTIALIFLCFSSLAQAYTEKELIVNARAATSSFLREIETISRSTVNDGDRISRLGNLIERDFDFVTVSKIALGRHLRQFRNKRHPDLLQSYYRAATSNQRNLLAKRLFGYLNWNFQVTGASVARRNTVRVHIQASLNSSRPVAITILLHPRNGRMKAYDLTIEGISQAISLRAEYSSFLANTRGSFPQKIRRLIQRLEAIQSI